MADVQLQLAKVARIWQPTRATALCKLCKPTLPANNVSCSNVPQHTIFRIVGTGTNYGYYVEKYGNGGEFGVSKRPRYG